VLDIIEACAYDLGMVGSNISEKMVRIDMTKAQRAVVVIIIDGVKRGFRM
jgi:hypothetical protein